MAPRVIVVGGGPAGLMAAETARAAGADVDLYERLGSVGRKFLIAGKGGLNLTHAEPRDAFVSRYGARRDDVSRWLDAFDAEALRAWARGLGVETFVGTSGRVFPEDLKAAPLLRAWLRRLRASGVRIHVRERWLGWDAGGSLRFANDRGEHVVDVDAVVFALGGASWPVLGSDGARVPLLESRGVTVAPLRASNVGFEVVWSDAFATRHAGEPVKPVVAEWLDANGARVRRQGELVVSTYGVEGSLVYAASAALRDTIRDEGSAMLLLDLAPGRTAADIEGALAQARGSRSLSEHWRRRAGIAGVVAGLVREALPRDAWDDAAKVASTVKALPLALLRPRPIDEAISSAGGIAFEALDEELGVRAIPGVFCAGEMVDWEAPTGGYLLTACFASGVVAGRAAAGFATRSVA